MWLNYKHHFNTLFFHFMFFANDLLLALYFICQTREMTLDKKQIQSIFLFESKMGV